MVSESAIHKEIDLIQTCIQRMAQNSFIAKGWTISLVGLVLSLADKAVEPFSLGAMVTCLIVGFWYLDAFFLNRERKYRKLYEHVILVRQTGDSSLLYSLDSQRFSDAVPGPLRLMFSTTLAGFYLVLVAVVLTLAFFRLFGNLEHLTYCNGA